MVVVHEEDELLGMHRVPGSVGVDRGDALLEEAYPLVEVLEVKFLLEVPPEEEPLEEAFPLVAVLEVESL